MEQGTRETGGEAADDGGRGGGGGGGCGGNSVGLRRQGIRWDQILPRRPLRVLLVEHDYSTRQVITALLRKCSYHVVGVADGLKAWEILQERRFAFDLVLTEVVMPSLSGIGLLTKVVATEECKNLAVIMMSSQDSIGVVLKCMLKGAVDFLVKPVRKNELRNLWQHVWRRHCSSSQANASENNYSAASNRISANVGDASKSGENSDEVNEVQSSGAKEEMEIESAQKFRETPSAEGASSSKEMQEQDPDAGAITVRTDAITNDSSKTDREGADTTAEANNSDAFPPNREPSYPTIDRNYNISKSQKDATQEESVVNKQSLDGCFKLKRRDVLNHSQSSAFSRYGEKKQQDMNDNPFSSSLHFRNGESFKGDLKASTSFPSKEDAINHQSVAPQLGFIPVHFPIGSVPYGYTTILHPIYYPSYPPPNNSTAQTTCDESNKVRPTDNNASEAEPDVEKGDSRELNLVIQRGSCSQDVAIASGSGETDNGNTSTNGNLESGNESAAHTCDRYRREAALIKFRLKRKDRCFEKKVRYYNRKKLAEQRPRLKGQFVSQKA